MALIIPVRMVTAVAGMLVGYYAGICLEHRWKKESSLEQFAKTVSYIYTTGQALCEDEDMSCEDMEFSSTEDESYILDSSSEFSDEE